MVWPLIKKYFIATFNDVKETANYSNKEKNRGHMADDGADDEKKPVIPLLTYN